MKIAFKPLTKGDEMYGSRINIYFCLPKLELQKSAEIRRAVVLRQFDLAVKKARQELEKAEIMIEHGTFFNL